MESEKEGKRGKVPFIPLPPFPALAPTDFRPAGVIDLKLKFELCQVLLR